MIDFLFSAVLFLFVSFAIFPVLCFNIIVTQFLQAIWFGIVTSLKPELEFIRKITVRSLLDTHRNQGIGAILLCIAGPAQPEAVRYHLNELVNRRNKNGSLAFPRLRDNLIIKYGTYAWRKESFDLDKNFTVVPGIFKNRPVTESNIQEYVNDLVLKYLPQNSSPWHMIIIPTLENHHYILLKLHHILLNEHLNIGDLLPLIPPTRYNSQFIKIKSPLINVVKEPESLPRLQEQLSTEMSNYWNEFVSNYDPLENTDLLKNNPTVLKFLAIFLVAFISTFKETRRGMRVVKNDMFSKYTFVSDTFKREMKKRQINISNFITSLLISMNPKNLLMTYFSMIRFLLTTLTIRVPSLILSEFLSFVQCVSQKYSSYPNTIIGAIYIYIPLIYGSLKECTEIVKIIFYAPRNIILNILCQKEYLQTVTLSGRKCVSWSDPIKKGDLKIISRNLNVSELEILLACLSKNLSKYLNEVDHGIPEEIPISLRNINSNYIFATGVNVRPEDSCSGIIFTELPIFNEFKDHSILENLVRIKNNLKESMRKQQVSYILTILQTKFRLLTKILPSTLLAIYLRYLSRKFSISVTEVSNRYPSVHQRTIWGTEVVSAIYWRPPQANICISLCLNEYADDVRLGVMCDARLIPNHTLLAKNFSSYIEEFGKIAGHTNIRSK